LFFAIIRLLRKHRFTDLKGQISVAITDQAGLLSCQILAGEEITDKPYHINDSVMLSGIDFAKVAIIGLHLIDAVLI